MLAESCSQNAKQGREQLKHCGAKALSISRNGFLPSLAFSVASSPARISTTESRSSHRETQRKPDSPIEEFGASNVIDCDKLCRESEKPARVRRRKIDGCPIAGALQLIGDKWTLLVVRELFARPKRTTELLEELHPISSRTLMGRLKEMETDELIVRVDYGGLPRRVEYELTDRGRRLVPLLDALMKTGQMLDCNDCEDRKQQLGYYCDFCPNVRDASLDRPTYAEETPPARSSEPAPVGRPKDDSIVLL